MKSPNLKNQSGVALIIFVLMLMSVGGYLLVGYSQGLLKQVEVSKTEHNTRVLNEAKLALLQFAYNYPVLSTPSIGPGRLPNADTDNDGIADGGSTFGRLPWAQANLNLYDIRDADGERLWYAVSSTFRPQAAFVNSDTSGNLTLRDQQGNVIYDGSNPGGLAQYGIAAVIIAPGAVTARNGAAQDRSVANADDPFDTTADTDPGIINAANYLDLLFGTEDNATRTLGSPTDGFILGPVDTLSTDAVNDQFIVITAEEVIAMAEKATLQAYRTVINDYRVDTSYCDGEIPDGATTEALCLAAATPGTWTLGPYPWLYNYTGVPDVAGLSSYYPVDSDWATELATNLDNIGRIPARPPVDYFTETDSAPVTFETEISGSVGITISETVSCTGCPNSFTLNDDEFKFYDFSTVKLPKFPDPQILTNAEFVNIADVVGNDGRLTGTSTAAVSGTIEMYFWDDDQNPDEIWTPCGDDGDGIPELTDCNRDISGNPKPGGTNDEKSWILRMLIPTDTPFFNAGVVNIDMNYATAPLIEIVPATDKSHSVISGIYTAANIINGTMPTISGTITWELDEHYHTDEGAGDFDPSESGDITSNVAVAGPLKLGIRYYPDLPDWVFDNDWHNSVMMAYAFDYRPDQVAPCSEATDCIQINNLAGNNDNKISILTIAGQHDWNDQGLNGLFDDVGDVFDVENEDLDRIFDARAALGNDKILIIEECAIAACP